jgi:hypothetical protein
MVVYTFKLNPKGDNNFYPYARDLSPFEEDHPEQIFTSEVRKSLQQKLQKDCLCAIKENHLEQIIKIWIEDIKEGYRETYITLDLPSILHSNIEQVQEQGNQELPSLISPKLSEIEPNHVLLPPIEEIFNPEP